MPSPWLRLACDFHDDDRIIEAGPDAALVWPHVLALLKRKDGVAPDGELRPVILSRRIGGDVEQWERGLAGLRAVGLLVEGSKRVHLGRKKFEDVAGWGTPNWARYQPDPRYAAAFRPTGNDRQRPTTTANGGQSLPTTDARGNPVRPVPSSPVGLSGSGKDIINNAPESNDDWNALDLYRRLGGRGMAIPSTGKVKGKPVMLSALMVAICNQNDGATIDDLVAESATKGNGLDWFLACFDPDTGRKKAKPAGRRGGPTMGPVAGAVVTDFRSWLNADTRRSQWMRSVARLHGDGDDEAIWSYMKMRGDEWAPPESMRADAIEHVRLAWGTLL